MDIKDFISSLVPFSVLVNISPVLLTWQQTCQLWLLLAINDTDERSTKSYILSVPKHWSKHVKIILDGNGHHPLTIPYLIMLGSVVYILIVWHIWDVIWHYNHRWQVILMVRWSPKLFPPQGGITSSDLATKALGARCAKIVGQALPGVPLWLLGPESKHPEVPYIVFPGNLNC